MGHAQHTITVFAPTLYLTVTIEKGSEDNDEVHIHPGGQGFWIARMLRHLGERPLLTGPVGGEPGQVFLGLLTQWGMDVSPMKVSDPTVVNVNDRRSGERNEVAASPPPRLQRHEVDDAYGRILDHAMGSGVCVVTGQSQEIVPREVFRRLGHDLASAEVKVVADLHGPELDSFLEGGPIDILKVSDEDLVGDRILEESANALPAYVTAIDTLMAKGAKAVVISRQHQSAIAKFGSKTFEAATPELEPADHRGAGDSMTAGLASAMRRGLPAPGVLRLGCAAGAANVTRHGLGSADPELIESLRERVEVRELTPEPT